MRLLKFLFFTLSFISCVVYAESVLQVNVNKAPAILIKEALSGVGEKKAQAIIDYRNTHGEFNSAYDLMLVSGIGKKTVEKNLDRILLTNPEPVIKEIEEADKDTQTEEESLNSKSNDIPESKNSTEQVKTSIQGQASDIEPYFSSELKITIESLNAAQQAGKQVIYPTVE